ncbi:hypothetical protein PAXINDRAFT_17505 [Paxillus involutus ATCC 200175]|uniref:Uncharacterized protein n=1 Tax=Paxillus involutus ATCC 200175 TaxID=664439 RepID=A0A0C9TNJ9_PAXIN|nr:hypothetical protein PAXINDRAFT_17505 [Paxillus involutus ATCC 200175]
MAAMPDIESNDSQTIVVPTRAMIWSSPPSVGSASIKNNTFRIYPFDLLSAIELCLSAERYTDAILLAIQGGDELLQRTQNVYFERRTPDNPYLCLFQSIVTNDLDDVVQNGGVVILCKFTSAEEFGGLAEQSGVMVKFQAGDLKRGWLRRQTWRVN